MSAKFQELLRSHPIPSLETLTGITFSPFQVAVLESKNPRICVLSPRQSGKSFCIACKAFLAMMNGEKCATLQPSVRQSSGLVDKVRALLFQLGITPEICSRTEIVLENGGSIVAIPIKNTSRGGQFQNVYLDELSWIETIVEDDILGIALPFLSKPGSRLVIASSPRGRHGLFYKIWTETNDFEKIEGTVAEVRHYDPDYLRSQLVMQGPIIFGREFLNRFDELDEISLFSELDFEKLRGTSCIKSSMEPISGSCNGIAALTSQPVREKATTLRFV